MTLSKFSAIILCSIPLAALVADDVAIEQMQEAPVEAAIEVTETLPEQPLATEPLLLEIPLQTPAAPVAASETKHYVPRPYIEEKFGYFFFTSTPMNQIYNQGGIDLQLSGLYPLCSYLGLYASVEYLQKSGHSLGGHQRTTFWEVPLSLGLQPSVPLKSDRSVIYYVTVGPRYVFAGIRNHSSFVPRTGHAHNIGGFINTGFMVNAYKELKIDFFTEYSFVRLKFHTSRRNVEAHSVQGGGVVFGAGLIYRF